MVERSGNTCSSAVAPVSSSSARRRPKSRKRNGASQCDDLGWRSWTVSRSSQVISGSVIDAMILRSGNREVNAAEDRGSALAARALRRDDREEVRLPEAVLGERAVEGDEDAADRVDGDESDGRAAEAAAGHARADRAVRLRRLHGEVELGHGDLEVVAHGDVGGVEQLADGG